MLFEKWLGGPAALKAEEPDWGQKSHVLPPKRLRPGGLDAFLAAWKRTVARYSKKQSGPSQILLQATASSLLCHES